MAFVQTLAVVVVAAYAGVGTFIICFIIDKLFGLKISPEKEEEGDSIPAILLLLHLDCYTDCFVQDWISPNTRNSLITT